MTATHRVRLRRRHPLRGQDRDLKITDDELSGFRFCARDEEAELLRPYVWQRAANALETGRARYFHRATSAATPSGRSLP